VCKSVKLHQFHIIPSVKARLFNKKKNFVEEFGRISDEEKKSVPKAAFIFIP